MSCGKRVPSIGLVRICGQDGGDKSEPGGVCQLQDDCFRLPVTINTS
jgi:hypothetical protein